MNRAGGMASAPVTGRTGSSAGLEWDLGLLSERPQPACRGSGCTCSPSLVPRAHPYPPVDKSPASANGMADRICHQASAAQVGRRPAVRNGGPDPGQPACRVQRDDDPPPDVDRYPRMASAGKPEPDPTPARVAAPPAAAWPRPSPTTARSRDAWDPLKPASKRCCPFSFIFSLPGSRILLTSHCPARAQRPSAFLPLEGPGNTGTNVPRHEGQWPCFL